MHQKRPFYFVTGMLVGGILLCQPAFSQSTTKTDSSKANQEITMPELVVKEQKNPLRNYRASAPRINDLVSTRLEVRFDFSKSYLYGKEWVTLQPHFYPTDSLTLDAKGMDIHEVALVQGAGRRPLSYQYSGMELRISLGRLFTRGEKYTVYIDYTSRPDEYAAKNPGGSATITQDKGLYFINPDGKNPYKPTEVWTQGETEANSVWFPTIDKPDQKSLEQISMTVPGKFTTLSNGKLVAQKKNADGTRTDTWKMEHPNSPYLFMMAAGPFVIVKDHWKNIPVDYYVEKEYAADAKAIFGRTPAMIDFYSKILGVPYQWSKYDQIVARDYVSGAMENTTATLHGEFLYKTPRQLLDDDYRNESVIAHELFHHWFGDLVTCESWSNITLNESFADFSEMLWAEHAYGKDQADQHSYQAMQDYFRIAMGGNDHPLVDFYYHDKEDVFDDISYQKGGRILNMLRNYVGDEAFFRSLQYYLTEHKFHPAEAQQLRLAFEHVTGKDLNWFWNQWYYGEGYPRLDIRYDYNDAAREVSVIVKQTQDDRLFELPFAIDVYAGGQKTRHQVVMMDRVDTFSYPYAVRPDLINVDADKVLLAQKDDHKTIENYIYQFYHAPLYLDRREAITACAKEQTGNEQARKVMIDALRDKFYGLRSLAIQQLALTDDGVKNAAIPVLKDLAAHDPKSSVRANALKALVSISSGNEYSDLVQHGLKDPSYLVEATALAGLNKYAPDEAYKQAKGMEADALSPLTATICDILAKAGHPEDFPFVSANFEKNGSFDKFGYINPYLSMLAKDITDNTTVMKGVDEVRAFAQDIGPRYGMYVMSMLENFVRVKKEKATNATGTVQEDLNKQADYAGSVVQQLQRDLSSK